MVNTLMNTGNELASVEPFICIPEDRPVEYSGQFKEGLNASASYDRMIFADRQRIFEAVELWELLRDMSAQFRASGRSRVVVRVLAAALEPGFLRAVNLEFPGAEMDFFPDSEGRFNYFTFSLNRADRAVDNVSYAEIVDRLRTRVAQIEGEWASFEQDALQNLGRARGAGLMPTLDIGERELTRIWEPFGWTREAVATLLHGEGRDVVMGMRNDVGRLVAVAMYNDQTHDGIRNGETTEWTTDPEFGMRGVIQPLLITLHSYLLSQGIGNIWADLRTPDSVQKMPHSITPAVRSGMRIFDSSDHRFLASNHVTIGGDSQSYNRGSSLVLGQDVPRSDLRTFVRGWVDGRLFTSRLTEECLNNLTLR